MPVFDTSTQAADKQQQVLYLLSQERVQHLFHNLPTSILVSLLIATILSMAHWKVLGHAELIIWNLILCSVLIARLLLWIFWRYTSQVYSVNLWLILFRLGVWATGITWGLSAFFLFAHNSSLHQALLAFSIAGVASGSLTSLTLDRWSAIGFVVSAVFPLSITLYQQEGAAAIPMFSMSLLFIFFVITTTKRAQKTLEDQLTKTIELAQFSNQLQHKHAIETIIHNTQELFIREKNGLAALKYILHKTLAFSTATLGFIGRIDKSVDGQPYMKALVFAGDKSLDAMINRYQATHLPERGEFKNLENLFGAAISSGKTVISHNLGRDMRAAQLPPGHPPVNTFMAIPIYSEGQMVALLGLANSSRNFEESLEQELVQILNSMAQLVQTVSHEEDHARDKATLIEAAINTQVIVDNVADGIIMIDQHGIIQSFNKAAEIIFGYKKNKVIGENVSMLMPEPYKSMHDTYIFNYLRTHKGNIINKGREVLGLRKNGQVFPMDLIVSVVMQSNQPLFIGVVRDISEKSKSYSSLQSNTTQLIDLISNIHQLLCRQDQESDPSSHEHNEWRQLERALEGFIKQFFFIEKDIKKIKLPVDEALIKSLQLTGDKTGINNQDIHLTKSRSPLFIDCDPTSLTLALNLLMINILKVRSAEHKIEIVTSEAQGMAQVQISVRLKAPVRADAIEQQLLSICRFPSSSQCTIIDLLSLSKGRCQIMSNRPAELTLSLQFPLTLKL